MTRVNPDRTPSSEPSTAGAPATEGRNTNMPEEQGALTIEARRSRITDIGGRLQEIAGTYPAAVLPTDTQAEWDQLVAERRDHQAALDAVDARNAVLAETLVAATNTHDRPQAGTPSASPQRPQAPAVHIKGDIYDIGAIRQQARSLDDLPALYRENAQRAIDEQRFPGTNREDAQENVTKLLATVTDDKNGVLARRILATGSPGYSRVFGRALASGNPGVLGGRDAQILALGEATDAGGGYAVPFQLDPTIVLTSDGATNPIRSISRVERVVGKEFDLVSSAGVTVTRVAEATPAPDGSPTLAQPKVRTERVQGFIPFSVELEGDWTALQAEMMRLLADAKDIEEATSFTTGNGTAPAAGGIVGTLPVGQTIATATTNVLALTDLYGLKNALGPRFRSRGQWMANSAVYDVMRGFGTSIANIWAESLQVGVPSKFIGYPVNENSIMDSAITTTKKIALFGDFSNYLIVDQVGMNMELIPQLFQQATAGAGVGLPTGQRGYFAWWRNNAVIVNPTAFRLLKVL
jgi:HK97 family phage major capsid protein